jgi:Dolichyl-phosphate-mannose-protein mannosyltransferase
VAVATRQTAPPRPEAEKHEPPRPTARESAVARITRNPTLAIVAILAVATTVRLFQLGHDSLWIDEVTVAWRSHPHRVLEAVRDAGAMEPPASYLVTAPWLQLPLSLETAVRLPMAIFGVLEVFALYLLGRELTRKAAVGLIAALLLAVAPFAVRYSQEAEQYVMFSALHLLAWWLLLRALRRRRIADWVALGVCNGALLLTHQYAPIVIAVQLCVLAVVVLREGRVRPSSARSVVRGGGISILIASVIEVPWLIYSLLTSASLGTLVSPDRTTRQDLPLAPDLAKRAVEYLFGNETHMTVLAVVLAALCVASPLVTRGRDRRVVVGVAAYVLGFALLLVFANHVVGTYFAFRRVEFLLPLLLLLAAMAIVRMYDRLREHEMTRRVAIPALALGLAAVVGLSTVRIIDYYGTEKTNLRAIGELGGSTPESTILMTFCIPSDQWAPRVAEYAAEHGLDRPLLFLDSRYSLPPVTPGVTRVLLFSTVPVSAPGWETRPLNDVDRVQVIAGDQNWGRPIVPLYAARSAPASDADLSSLVSSLRRTRRCLVEAP